MLGTLFADIARKHNLTTASGMAYGLLNGCFVTLSEEPGVQRISLYVGGQEATPPGYADSHTVSCAKQILHTISTASGPENLYALMTGNEQIPALILNHAGSVVTVNFPDAPEARAGIERFIDELLPVVANLTNPKQCIFCCQPTQGDAVPVRLSADTVAPMHLPCYEKAADLHAPTKEESAAQHRAILGAAGGALIGAVLWALLSRLTPYLWIVGVLMGLLPLLAYDLLKGKPGKQRIATLALCAAAAVLVGTLGASLMDLHMGYARNLTVMQAQSVSEWTYIWVGVTTGQGTMPTFVYRLLAGLLTAAIGCLGCLRGNAAPTAEASKPRRLKGSF